MRLSFIILLSAFTLSVTCESALAKTAKHSKATREYYDVKDDVIAVETNDPWESLNKPIFNFNLMFDRHVFKPAITVYDNVPHSIRRSISNFLSNLYEPFNAMHGILQLNPDITFTSLWRFILNSTFGLAGLQDFAADNAHLYNMRQNLGKTLGRWGVPSGPYVVLPILGPSSVRDATGQVVDWFVDPVRIAVDNSTFNIVQGVATGIDARDRNAKIIDQLYYDSLDPYASSRSVYLQNEKFQETSRQ
jgi:phospholipid-binding lipoprotein MlaA